MRPSLSDAVTDGGRFFLTRPSFFDAAEISMRPRRAISTGSLRGGPELCFVPIISFILGHFGHFELRDVSRTTVKQVFLYGENENPGKGHFENASFHARLTKSPRRGAPRRAARATQGGAPRPKPLPVGMGVETNTENAPSIGCGSSLGPVRWF